MKNLLYSISILLLIISSYACDKDKICTSTDPCSPTVRYFPMTVGNYWIYEARKFDPSNDMEEVRNPKDTIRIIGDTLIGSNTYFIFESDSYYTPRRKETSFLRDSSGYIIDESGVIRFTANYFDGPPNRVDLYTVLGSTYYLKYSIEDSIVYKTTPAGTFDCLDYKACLFRNGTKNPTNWHNYYSEDIGLIYQNTTFASGRAEVRRYLCEYHLED